jgi:hypothetical protein
VSVRVCVGPRYRQSPSWSACQPTGRRDGKPAARPPPDRPEVTDKNRILWTRPEVRRAGPMKSQVTGQKPGMTVSVTAPTLTVRAPSVNFKGQGTLDPRTHSGRRQPAITPRMAYPLASGTRLGQKQQAVKPLPEPGQIHVKRRGSRRGSRRRWQGTRATAAPSAGQHAAQRE